MKTIVFIALVLFIAIQTYAQYFNENAPNKILEPVKKDSLHKFPGIAVYAELLGKGFYSLNVDFPIKDKHRFSFGLTVLDYDIENVHVGRSGALTPGLMYYYLIGRQRSFFELGAGFSLFYHPGADYVNDSPLSLHGVIGYRYQKKDGVLFRIGFTPFKRINSWFLPLIGVSLGYSW